MKPAVDRHRFDGMYHTTGTGMGGGGERGGPMRLDGTYWRVLPQRRKEALERVALLNNRFAPHAI